MTTIEQAFIECMLADLAYVGTLQKAMSLQDRIDEFARRITQPLAEQFAARFEILAVKSDPVSDYQAVVFKDVTTGDLYLANRGTESGTDIGNADLDLALGRKSGSDPHYHDAKPHSASPSWPVSHV